MADEALPADTPVLRMLRGDFLRQPFGDSELADETRGHGRPANGTWRVTGQTATALDIALDGDVMGAAVTARIDVRPGHSVVYQRHVLTGGAGRLPLGHHAMLRAEPPLLLGFSPWRWAGTPEAPVEVPPAGRSLLAYPQVISDPRQARRADGGRVDLTRYPVAEGHEDIWMLVAAADQPFAWSAATASGAGWVWFALKDPRLLPATTLWLSDGGRIMRRGCRTGGSSASRRWRAISIRPCRSTGDNRWRGRASRLPRRCGRRRRSPSPTCSASRRCRPISAPSRRSARRRAA